MTTEQKRRKAAMSDTQIPEKTETETTPRTTAEEFFHLLELARAELDIRKLYERPVQP